MMAKRTLEKIGTYDPYRSRTLETPKQREKRKDIERRDGLLELKQVKRDEEWRHIRLDFS